MAIDKKLILVIGGTGAQGLSVIEGLLKPTPQGSPSPYAIRVLTRDVTSARAKDLTLQGIECVQGTPLNFADVSKAMQGVYGAFVNLDSFAIGEEKEVFAGLRIFEIAKQAKVKHYVWSALPYVHKISGFNSNLRVPHLDGKGRVADFLKSQASSASGDELTWSVLTTGFYLEMLTTPALGPIKRRDDGVYVFPSAFGNKKISLIGLADIGVFSRYIFDNREKQSAKNLLLVSDVISPSDIVSTFKKVTGKPAVSLPQSLDQFFQNFDPTRQAQVVREDEGGVVTLGDYFKTFWGALGDRVGWDIDEGSLNQLREINPEHRSLEKWMRETSYSGDIYGDENRVLQSMEGDDFGVFTPNWSVVDQL